MALSASNTDIKVVYFYLNMIPRVTHFNYNNFSQELAHYVHTTQYPWVYAGKTGLAAPPSY